MPQQPVGDPRGSSLRLALQHAGTLAALGTFALVVAKLLVESRFDVSVAVWLVALASAPTILLATAVSATPFVVGIAAAWSWQRFWAKRAMFRVGAPLLAVAISTTLLALSVAPIAYLVGVLVGTGEAHLRLRRLGRDSAAEASALPRPLWTYADVIVATLFVFFFLSISAWIAPESVQLKDGTRTTAYVVGISDGWAYLLEADTRHPRVVPIEEISGRDVCSVGRSALSMTLPELLRGDRPRLALCEGLP